MKKKQTYSRYWLETFHIHHSLLHHRFQNNPTKL